MQFVRPKFLYLPALSIIAVVVILLGTIGISTYRNLERERATALLFMQNQGTTLIKAIEAGVRTGMMMPMWEVDDVDLIIREIARSDSIAYVYIFDRQGRIKHHTHYEKEGLPVQWQPTFEDDLVTRSRVVVLPDGKSIFELAKQFAPIPSDKQPPYRTSMMNAHQGQMRRHHSGEVIVLGLHMTPYDQARRADLNHAVVMAAVLIALGSAVFFFMFVIQNYYLVKKTLHHTRDYTRQVLSSMADGLVSVDAEGRIVSYNELALQMLGLTEQEFNSRRFQDIVDFRHGDGGCPGTNSVMHVEIVHRRKDGDTIPILLSATPMCSDAADTGGVVFLLRDLTEIKRLEERVSRSEKLAAVGRLAAGVAHEIRNPLSSVRGFARFLQQRLNDRPTEREYARIMVNEVDRINGVVNDLLTLARPKDVRLAPVDLKALMQHVVRLVEADARRRSVDIRLRTEGAPASVSLDGGQITQALLNLLLNALNAVEPGGAIETGAAVRSSPDPLLELWVEDDGCGIDSGIVEKIFDPFFTTRPKGNGLGLAIVQSIVENHDGDIELESPVPGKTRGSRFTLKLPLWSQPAAGDNSNRIGVAV